MPKLTYSTRLIFSSQDDETKLFRLLESHRLAWNEASKVKYTITRNSIVDLHDAFYYPFRAANPDIPAQVVIRGEQECLSAYRSAKSNKVKIEKPFVKKRLSVRLDKHLYSYKGRLETLTFSLTTLERRIKVKPYLYPKLSELLSKHIFADPLLFVRNGKIFIAFTFDIPETLFIPVSACGIDLGIRMAAVTSEGKFYQDKQFNHRKRKIRYLKRKLQSASSKSSSAKKHLARLRRKEKNANKNQSHLLSNAILSGCSANLLVIEDLAIDKMKRESGKKSQVCQVPFYQLRTFLSYKAPLYGKQLLAVSPHNTSRIDHRTGKKDGERKGRRYYGKDGVVLDADQNASINIALRSKHPVSYVTILDGQGVVSRPIVGALTCCSQAPTL